MKYAPRLFAILLLVLSSSLNHAAPLGTAFTYQGKLSNGGNPANGSHDLVFSLYDASASGGQVGSSVTNVATPVAAGLFTVTLDFGAGVFNGNARWLEIAVRTSGGGAFTTLTPRQPLAPAPHALYAPTAGAAATATSAQGVAANAVTSAGIASGQVVKSLNGLKDVVRLAAGPNVTLATNANTLTISAAGGGASGGWTTTGNAGTTPVDNFLGTTDGQPLVLQANNVGVNTTDPQATLHVNGTMLATQFAGDGSGLTNVPAALATPFTLTTLAGTNSGGHARGVAISGHYAYVAEGYAGLHVYDISDPAHPSHVGPATDLAGGASAVALSGQHAFVAGDTLYSVDISSPANPVIVGSAPGTRSCYGVAVLGNIAYLAADADGLFTYNIANPTAPVSLGHIDNGGNALGVTASGDFAYLANDSDGLRIYNISNPTNPVSVGHVFDDGYAFGVAVSGRYAYVANNNLGLRIYDVSDPAHPTSVGVAPISGEGVALAVAVAGHYAFTANEMGGLVSYFAAPLATVPGVIGAMAFMGDGSGLTNLNVDAGQLTGQLTGDGSGLTNLNAAQLAGQIPASALGGAWKLGGNAGTIPAQSLLGTTDEQPFAFIVHGQRALRLEPASHSPNVIGGYQGNIVSNGVFGATIGGGGADFVLWRGLHPIYVGPNRVGDMFATVVGGSDNTASGEWSTAMGGSTTASGPYSTAMGEATSASAYASTAMGLETIASGASSTAMGDETIASGHWSTAMGSHTTASGDWSTATGYGTTASNWSATAMGWLTTAGGKASTAMGDSTTASGDYSTAVGASTSASGWASTAMGTDTTASGDHSTAMGKATTASGYISTAMGISSAAASSYTMAAGRRAKANHQGDFVWADSMDADFSSTAPDQFLIRAAGGVGINKNNPTTALDVTGTVTATAFSQSSDRSQKEEFTPVNPAEVLDKVAALAISRWHFKGDAATPHVGPMAQDFHAAFGVGTDDKHIATVDADGVALAAIQGLNLKLEEQRVENAALEKQVAELKALVESLAAKVNGGAR